MSSGLLTASSFETPTQPVLDPAMQVGPVAATWIAIQDVPNRNPGSNVASEEQRVALRSLAESRDRGEADRARAVLLTLAGWTSPRIAEPFGVREDTVRLWRSDFVRGGVAALKANVAPGPAPVKSE